MENNVYFNTTTPISTSSAGNTSSLDRLAQELEESEKFQDVLAEIDALQETPEERAERLKEEDAAIQAKQDLRKKLNELTAQLAKLQSMLSGKGGNDPALLAQISSLQTQIFWLTMSL